MASLMSSVAIGIGVAFLTAFLSAYYEPFAENVIRLASRFLPEDEVEEQVNEWLAIIEHTESRRNRAVALSRLPGIVLGGVLLGGKRGPIRLARSARPAPDLATAGLDQVVELGIATDTSSKWTHPKGCRCSTCLPNGSKGPKLDHPLHCRCMECLGRIDR